MNRNLVESIQAQCWHSCCSCSPLPAAPPISLPIQPTSSAAPSPPWNRAGKKLVCIPTKRPASSRASYVDSRRQALEEATTGPAPRYERNPAGVIHDGRFGHQEISTRRQEDPCRRLQPGDDGLGLGERGARGDQDREEYGPMHEGNLTRSGARGRCAPSHLQ